MAEETTIYPLAEKHRPNVRSSRCLAWFSLALIVVEAVMLPGFLWHQALSTTTVDWEALLALSSLLVLTALICIVPEAMNNFTVRVELQPDQCLVADVFGQKKVKYSEIGNIEKLQDFRCYRKLYYSFILLAAPSGRQLAIIQHTVDDLDRLAEDLERRCRPFGAVRLAPNDPDGPGWRALTVASARWNRIVMALGVLMLAGVTSGGLYDLRGDLELYNEGPVIAATIYQHDLKARPCARYKFSLSDGREFRRDFKKCESVALGDEIEVKYWPGDPRKNRPVSDLKYPYANTIGAVIFSLVTLALAVAIFIPKAYRGDFVIKGKSYAPPETAGPA